MKNGEEIIETTDDGDAETEAAAKALTDAGDEVGALKMKLERSERRLKKERESRRQVELVAVRDTLAKEFEYADPDLITGRSEAEMRASAERQHNAVVKAIAKKGLIPSNLTPEQINAAEAAKLKSSWGVPPPVATEAVTGEAPMDYSDLNANARSGKMSRGEVLKDIKDFGPRRITRPTIASAAIRGRGEAPKTA